jgi:hypothetical protein
MTAIAYTAPRRFATAFYPFRASTPVIQPSRNGFHAKRPRQLLIEDCFAPTPFNHAQDASVNTSRPSRPMRFHSPPSPFK